MLKEEQYNPNTTVCTGLSQRYFKACDSLALDHCLHDEALPIDLNVDIELLSSCEIACRV